MQLKIEREALKKETDRASKERLERLEKELGELEEQADTLTQAWQAEKEKLGLVQKMQGGARHRRGSSSSRRNGAAISARAGELAYGVIPDARKEDRGDRGEAGDTARWSRRR